jgi:hypothetical protein
MTRVAASRFPRRRERSWRLSKGGERFCDEGEPVTLDLFSPDASLFASDRLIVAWRLKIVAAVMERIVDRPPLKCWTCERAFVADLPVALGYARPIKGDDREALTMAFCAECHALPEDELHRRVIARVSPHAYLLVEGEA